MRGSRIFWAGAVLSAVGAASAVLLLVGHARHMERVVVARHGIPPWSLITPGDLTLAQRPVVGLLPGTILSMGQVQGRFAVTGLLAGEAVTAAALSGPDLASAYDAQLAALDGLTRHCTQGTLASAPGPANANGSGGTPGVVRCGDYTALPLPLTAEQGYDLFHAGSHIDLWATFSTPSGQVTDLVSPGVLVLAKFTPGASAPIVTATQQAPVATTGVAVIAVGPAEAARILEAAKLGSLTAGLEPIGGQPTAAGAPVTLATLLGPQAASLAPSQAGHLPAVAP